MRSEGSFIGYIVFMDAILDRWPPWGDSYIISLLSFSHTYSLLQGFKIVHMFAYKTLTENMMLRLFSTWEVLHFCSSKKAAIKVVIVSLCMQVRFITCALFHSSYECSSLSGGIHTVRTRILIRRGKGNIHLIL